MRKIIVKVLRLLGNVWLVINFLIFSITALWTLFAKGIWEFLWYFSPMNWMNYLALGIALSPGVLLLWLANKLEKKKKFLGAFDPKKMTPEEIHAEVKKRMKK